MNSIITKPNQPDEYAPDAHLSFNDKGAELTFSSLRFGTYTFDLTQANVRILLYTLKGCYHDGIPAEGGERGKLIDGGKGDIIFETVTFYSPGDIKGELSIYTVGFLTPAVRFRLVRELEAHLTCPERESGDPIALEGF